LIMPIECTIFSWINFKVFATLLKMNDDNLLLMIILMIEEI
jgi:hypothetical protein